MNAAPWVWSAVALRETGEVIGFLCAGICEDGSRNLGFVRAEALQAAFGKETEGNPLVFAAGKYEYTASC